MERIRTVDHQGREIVILDYSGLDPDGYKAQMRDAIRLLTSRPPKSALTVTVVKGTRFAVGTGDDVKAYSKAIQPHVRASAVVGLSPLQRVVYLAVRPFLSARIETFATVEQAKDWLVKQA